MTRRKIKLALTLLLVATTVGGYRACAVKPAAAGNTAIANQAPSRPWTMDAAWKLYTQRQYVASADAFESILGTASPDARLYYLAALANREAQRAPRAKQLFDYVVANFPQSADAGLAQSALTYMKAPAAVGSKSAGASGPAPGPASATASGPASATASGPASASASGTTTNRSLVAGLDGGAGTVRKKGAFAFTPQDIAKEGANGIDQTNAPNCWFECSMASLASLPKGQRLIASMIRYGDGNKYIVRFPGDGVEYVISEADMAAAGVKNHALWASLLDYAQRLKFPDNRGAEGAYADQDRLEVGLGCITGCRAEVLKPGQSSLEEIGSFIGGAVRSQNPVVAGTSWRNKESGDQPIIESHAYTVIGMDTAKNMIILRNPHGRRSKRFELPSDPQHLRFEQLEDGAFKMSLQTFHDSFGRAARSFI
jgi:hypothetical protein